MDSKPLFAQCYRHPERETSLRCNRCNQPVCPECAQQGAVGYRCPDCLHELAGRHYNEENKRYVNPLRLPMAQPKAVYVLLGIIVLIWVLEESAGGSTNNEVLLRFGATYGLKIIYEGEFWRLFSAMFLHIGIAHLLFNGFALYSLGTEMEKVYGTAKFVVIYLLSGIFGNVVSLAQKGLLEFSAGASGAVFGIAGMYLAFFVFYRKQFGGWRNPGIQRMMRLILINLVIGLSVGMINNTAHMGGLVAGFLLGLGLVPRYRPILTERGNELADLATIPSRWWVVLVAVLVIGLGTAGSVLLWQSSLTGAG